MERATYRRSNRQAATEVVEASVDGGGAKRRVKVRAWLKGVDRKVKERVRERKEGSQVRGGSKAAGGVCFATSETLVK